VALYVDLSSSYWVSVVAVATLNGSWHVLRRRANRNPRVDHCGSCSAGVASGLNNTISRFGGLVTTVLLSIILADRGDFLASGFDAAMIGGVALCGLATISPLLVRVDKARSPL
jgi:hypothetical protein